MMRIGMNLWHRDAKRIATMLEEARQLGIDHAEISVDYPFGIDNLEPFLAMARECRERGFTISIHAPWHEINIASPLEPIRVGSVEVLKRVVDNAYRVEALYLVIHATSAQPVCRGRYVEKCIEAARRSISELASYAEDRGMYLAVENVGDPCCGRIDQFAQVVRPPAYACIDVAHAYTFEEDPQRALNEVKYPQMLSRWVSAVGGDRVLVVHLHGVRARGKRLETHLEIDLGVLDPKNFAKAVAKSAKYLVFEVFRRSDGSEANLATLAEVLNELRSWILVYA